ncbi:hypothetical protein M758_1G026800 [Ceratodon purpureus]|nr:hypothetical protein M758_1G026800 [Ceratodon purpureus]
MTETFMIVIQVGWVCSNVLCCPCEIFRATLKEFFTNLNEIVSTQVLDVSLPSSIVCADAIIS